MHNLLYGLSNCNQEPLNNGDSLSFKPDSLVKLDKGVSDSRVVNQFEIGCYNLGRFIGSLPKRTKNLINSMNSRLENTLEDRFG